MAEENKNNWKERAKVVENTSRERIVAHLKERVVKRWKKRETGSESPYRVNWSDLYFEWIREWDNKFKGIEVPRWGRKDIAQAKTLIKKIGIDNAIEVIRYVFRNWDAIAKEAKREGGIPSMQFVLGWYEKFYVKALEEAKKLEQTTMVLDEWQKKQGGIDGR